MASLERAKKTDHKSGMFPYVMPFIFRFDQLEKAVFISYTRFFYKHIQIGTEARLCLDKFQIEAQIMLIVCLNEVKL